MSVVGGKLLVVTFTQTLLATLAGGLLGFLGAWRVSKSEREEAKADALLELYGEFSADLASAVSWIGFFPDSRDPGLLDRAVAGVRGELATWAVTQERVQRTLGPNWREPIERFARTSARLRLRRIPHYLLREIEAANAYVEELSLDRRPGVKARWPEVASAVNAAIKRAIDDGPPS